MCSAFVRRDVDCDLAKPSFVPPGGATVEGDTINGRTVRTAALCLVVTLAVIAVAGAAGDVDAQIEVGDGEVAKGEYVTFDASGTTAEGDIIAYEWNWNAGDGVYDASTTEPRIRTSFGSSGERAVEVRARTQVGHEDIAEIQLNVTDNEAPYASVDTSPDDPARNEAVWLDASDSQDYDGEIVAYRWDLDGDGAFDARTEDAMFRHAFEEEGFHQIRLQVIDDQGGEAEVPGSVNVDDDQAPSISLSVEPSRPGTGENVTIDATDVEDPDGQVVGLAFDTDGDRRVDLETDEPTAVNVSYAAAGEVEISVSAEDDDGHHAVETANITVESSDVDDGTKDGSKNDTTKPDADLNSDGDPDSEPDPDSREQDTTNTGDGSTEDGNDDQQTRTLGGDGGEQPADEDQEATIRDTTRRTGETGNASDAGGTGPLRLLVEPRAPAPGEPVQVQVVVTENTVEDVEWSVDGEPRPGGSFVELTFEEPGEHEVGVKVSTAAGGSLETLETITVEEGNASAANASASPNGVPGPGVGAGLVAAGLAATVARGRSPSEGAEGG